MSLRSFPDLTFHPARPQTSGLDDRQEPLRIIVVGAGLSGLAAGIAFAKEGHKVIIYETRNIPSVANAGEDDDGAAIALQPNTLGILKEWGLRDEVARIAHTLVAHDVRSYSDLSEKIVSMDLVAREEDRRVLALKRDFVQLLRAKATELGVRIHFGVSVTHIGVGDDQGGRPSVCLSNAEAVEADLLVAADGAESVVRRAMFPLHKTTGAAAFTAWTMTVPASILKDPQLKRLNKMYQAGHDILVPGPGKSVLVSPLPKRSLLSVEIIVSSRTGHLHVAHKQLQGWSENLTELKTLFHDADPAVTTILSSVKRAYQWPAVEAEVLSNWSCPSGRVVLLGDAAHPMAPCSSLSATLCLEDAAALALVFATASSEQKTFHHRLSVYENLRIPRCNRIREYTKHQAETWTFTVPEKVRLRNELWKKTEQDWWKDLLRIATSEMMADFRSPEFRAWVERYDVLDEVRRAKRRGVRL